MCMDRIISRERFKCLCPECFEICDWSQRNEGWETEKSSDDRTYIWWWDECEVSLKKRKRSVSTVAQMIGHNNKQVIDGSIKFQKGMKWVSKGKISVRMNNYCSYVRWSFLYWPISFLFEILSNRRSLVCIFNHHCVSESALSCLHIFSVWLMWYGIAGLNALEILSVGKRKILYLMSDALTWLGWYENWQYSGIYEGTWYGAHV